MLDEHGEQAMRQCRRWVGKMRVGITGHQQLPDESAWSWVRQEMDGILGDLPGPLIGLTSLAVGADQLFAEAVLRHGGTFTAIIPFHDYELKFSEWRDREEYNRLLRLAAQVEVLSKPGSSREAYFQAGKQVVNMAEVLLAVWDGQPAAGLGGTGDVVAYARQCGKPIVHINPITHTAISDDSFLELARG